MFKLNRISLLYLDFSQCYGHLRVTVEDSVSDVRQQISSSPGEVSRQAVVIIKTSLAKKIRIFSRVLSPFAISVSLLEKMMIQTTIAPKKLFSNIDSI